MASTYNIADKNPIPLTDSGGISRYIERRKCARRLRMPKPQTVRASLSSLTFRLLKKCSVS